MISRFAKSFLAIILALFLVATLSFLQFPSRSYTDPWTGDRFGAGGVEKTIHPQPIAKVPLGVAKGDVIMAQLGNATAKAELGRATWKLLHTMTLRYPEDPTPDQREALVSYMHLTSRLYPCGECAAEFQGLLKQFPPQTSSRRSAALWLCFVHNQVNERLHKPEFDCAHLDDTYDCGCGDAPVGKKKAALDGKSEGEDDATGAGLIKGG
jgi:hypothetical protein